MTETEIPQFGEALGAVIELAFCQWRRRFHKGVPKSGLTAPSPRAVFETIGREDLARRYDSSSVMFHVTNSIWKDWLAA